MFDYVASDLLGIADATDLGFKFIIYDDNDNTLAEDALDLSMGDDFPAAIEPGTLVRMKEKKSITIMISAWYIKEFP